MVGHRRIAEFTFGMFGRSPDHVASLRHRHGDEARRAAGALRARRQSPALLPPHPRQRHLRGLCGGAAAGRAQSRNSTSKQNIPVPTLRVVREEDDGVVISGMKMLATGALYANEIWIGNVIPLAPDQKKQAITCAVPLQRAGPDAVVAQAGERRAAPRNSIPRSPGATTRATACCCATRSRCPGRSVFVHDDALLSRDIYIKTPSHCFGNHQSNVRYWSKMRLLLGLCSKIAQATGADQVPAVRETSARWRRSRARIGGLVHGQINACEELARGLRLLQPPHHVCRRWSGARRTTASSSTSCASSAAAACSRCRPTSR